LTAAQPPEPRRARPQLSDDAASFIRELIMSGELAPGEFIRQERVAESLGISATPVREGLLSLRGEGFVKLEPRRGFVVSPLTTTDVKDLFWAQALMAGELAARAAARVQDEDLERLNQHQEELATLSASAAYDKMEHVNHLFHRDLNRVAQAPKMAWLLGVGARYVPRRFYSTIEGWPEASLEDHRAVLAAMTARSPEAARAAMQLHIVHAGDLLAAHRERIVAAATPPTGA
jgi:DNA-binding GntR family transcriptional regulator